LRALIQGARPALVFLCLAGIAGCVLSFDELAGAACEGVADCPSPMTCVGARPDAGRTCEMLRAPVDPPPPGVSPFKGPVPQYCQEIKPLFTAYCANNCHYPDFTNSAVTSFRLDWYQSDAGVAGAKAMASKIYRRVLFRQMPPPGEPQPTEEELSLISHWASAGGPFCDGGTDGG
jgi:hypothetical protein